MPDLASTLWHPHIVSVHDRGEYDDQLWISMDFIDGLVACEPQSVPVAGGPPAGGWSPWESADGRCRTHL